MTHYNTLNIKLFNSQLNNLKSGIKDGAEVTLNISLNAIGESNDENNFPHNFLLTSTQFLKLHKDFANNSSANINLSKTQLYKIGQSGGFLGRLRTIAKNWTAFNTIRINSSRINNRWSNSSKSVWDMLFGLSFAYNITNF